MHKYVPRQPGSPCSYSCPLLPSPPCGSQGCGKGDGFISHSIPGGTGSRGGRAGGASSPFPLPRAATWSPQVLGPPWVPGVPRPVPLTGRPSRQSAGRPAARAASAETSA